MALSVGYRGQIAVVIVGVRLGVEQGIFSGARPIHIAVRVDCLLRLRIGHGEEITVWIVPELGHAIDRIGELRDPVKRVRSVDGFLTEGVDNTS